MDENWWNRIPLSLCRVDLWGRKQTQTVGMHPPKTLRSGTKLNAAIGCDAPLPLWTKRGPHGRKLPVTLHKGRLLKIGRTWIGMLTPTHQLSCSLEMQACIACTERRHTWRHGQKPQWQKPQQNHHVKTS